MTIHWSPSPRTRPALAPAAPVSGGDPPAWPSAQGAYGLAGAARPGAVGAAGTPAGRVRGLFSAWNTGLEPLTGEAAWRGWWPVVGSVIAWCVLGLGLAGACWLVGWLLP